MRQRPADPERPAVAADPRDLARTIIALDPNIRRVTAQLFMRSRDEITRLCDGFTLLEPGLVWIPQWRPESPDDVPEDPSKYWALVGVACYDGPPSPSPAAD